MTRDLSFEEDVIDRLARIETAANAAGISHIDHELRIRGLERRMWTVGGAAAIVGAILTKLALPIHLPWS